LPVTSLLNLLRFSYSVHSISSLYTPAFFIPFTPHLAIPDSTPPLLAAFSPRASLSLHSFLRTAAFCQLRRPWCTSPPRLSQFPAPCSYWIPFSAPFAIVSVHPLSPLRPSIFVFLSPIAPIPSSIPSLFLAPRRTCQVTLRIFWPQTRPPSAPRIVPALSSVSIIFCSFT
jgi:hypothetical protein